MNILFLHRNFPAQFMHVASYFASNSNNNVVYLSEEKRSGIDILGVKHVLVPPPRADYPGMEKRRSAVLDRQVECSERYAAVMLELQKKGFQPDLIYSHPGWGGSFFTRDIFPNAAYASFCEWYYTKEADYSFFNKGRQKSSAEFAILRLRNLCQLNALSECDVAIAPTHWQKSRYPKIFQKNIHVLHDGIDINYFHPNHKAKLKLSGLDLSNAQEIITYSSRGLEPYRGFPQFYSCLPEVLKARPNCHVVIMAEDRTCYSPKPTTGTYGEILRKEVPLDMNRVHFTGFRPYDEYRLLLQASTVHVYLTAPFVLSWSMLEAMSCGALLVASDTEPVREVAKHNENALLTSFWDTKQLSDTIISALAKQEYYSYLRQAARKTIEDNYSLDNLLPEHIKLLTSVLD